MTGVKKGNISVPVTLSSYLYRTGSVPHSGTVPVQLLEHGVGGGDMYDVGGGYGNEVGKRDDGFKKFMKFLRN